MPTIYKNSRAYGETAVYGGFTPVGTIIPVMGNDAPVNYLKCDGAIYSISAYPELATYFKDQFGSAGYFGGNGTTTFGVPDLRGEFLRGAGTNSHTDQGNGATVGTHQDATKQWCIGTSQTDDLYIYPNGSAWSKEQNPDSQTASASGTIRKATLTNQGSQTAYSFYTARPTNTSVLYCIASKNIYIETNGGGSGTGGSEVYETTATLDEDIDDTTTVLAADLSGVDFDDILINVTLIRDAKGTLGLVTAKNGTTDVTVTTINTTTPTKELTQAQYDLLPTSEKNNGTTYYITDSFAGGTYVGAYETIYSTTEKVIGSYMGKPLYQKTFDYGGDGVTISNSTWTDLGISISDNKIERIVKSFGQSIGTSNDNCMFWFHAHCESSVTNVHGLAARYNGGVRVKYITLQYTKTTDTTAPVEYSDPKNYSFSEKIVGSWVNGVPIYQKTWEISNPAETTTLMPSGVTRIVDYEVAFDRSDGSGALITVNGDVNTFQNGFYIWQSAGTTSMTLYRRGTLSSSVNKAIVTVRYCKS